MNKFKYNKQLTLWLLVVIFMLPGVGAYWFYTHPMWLSRATTNKGKLLSPPLYSPSLANHGKWHLILWEPDACHLACREQLKKLMRIRMALGRRFYDVQLTLLTRDRPLSVSKRTLQALRSQHIQWKHASKGAAVSKVFIANPQRYLILSYALDADSADIFNDLQRLIK